MFNDDDLRDLQFTVEELPYQLLKEWTMSEFIHRRHVYCVTEITNTLTKQTAEEWAVVSAQYTKELERQPCFLPEGVAIVQEWIKYLRRLLRGMEATEFLPSPEGTSPTPTANTAADCAGPQPSQRELQILERLREAIALKGRTAKPEVLVKHAKLNHRDARNMLRWLESNGEYEGFARDRPIRFIDGRPNER